MMPGESITRASRTISCGGQGRLRLSTPLQIDCNSWMSLYWTTQAIAVAQSHD